MRSVGWCFGWGKKREGNFALSSDVSKFRTISVPSLWLLCMLHPGNTRTFPGSAPFPAVGKVSPLPWVEAAAGATIYLTPFRQVLLGPLISEVTSY